MSWISANGDTVKNNDVAIHTLLDMATAASIVNNVFRQHKAMVEPIEMSSNPLDQLEGQPDLAVVGSRAGKMNQWVVQVYFEDLGADGTLLTFVAIGDGGFTRAFGGIRHTASLTKSTEQMNHIIRALHQADSSLKVIDKAEIARIEAEAAAMESKSFPPAPPGVPPAVTSMTPPGGANTSNNRLLNQGTPAPPPPQPPSPPTVGPAVRTTWEAPVVAQQSKKPLLIAGAAAVALVVVLVIGIAIGSSSNTVATPAPNTQQSQPAVGSTAGTDSLASADLEANLVSGTWSGDMTSNGGSATAAQLQITESSDGSVSGTLSGVSASSGKRGEYRVEGYREGDQVILNGTGWITRPSSLWYMDHLVFNLAGADQIHGRFSPVDAPEDIKGTFLFFRQ